jgi:hypothetical protein
MIFTWFGLVTGASLLGWLEAPAFGLSVFFSPLIFHIPYKRRPIPME